MIQLSLFPEIEEEEYKKAETEFLALRAKLEKKDRYYADEKEYQEAQEEWDKTGSKAAWNVMYLKIQKACFNCINQKLIKKVPDIMIEDYSHDVTLNILNQILKKKDNGKFWKIAKLSAFVHMPCMAIYEKQKEFEDKILDESAFTLFDDNGNEKMKESEDTVLEDGIIFLRGKK